MIDGFGRRIEYLRVSVTVKCNLRCVYCMPEEGLPWLHREQLLSYEEIVRIVGPVKDPAEFILLGEFVASGAYRTGTFANYKKLKGKAAGI